MENFEQDHLAEMDLSIDGDVREQLNETARWTKFISIVVFVACGLLLLVGVLGGAALLSTFRRFGAGYGFPEGFGGGAVIAVVIIFAAVLGVLYYFLFNFSQKIKIALLTDSTEDLNAGLKSMKIYFIVTTSLAIISLLNTIYRVFF